MAQFVLNTLTLLNINRFSKFFHCRDQEKICNNIITKDPTSPQVCRNTSLWNVRKSWFRLACQEWVRLASSSSSQEPRLTANITVNMFSVAVYCLTSVQDTSATPGPCSKTAHRHTLLGTHWRTWECHVHRAWHVAPKQPGLESSWLRCLRCPSADVYQRRRFRTINQLQQAIVIEWGKLLQRFIDRAIGQWRRRLECVVQQQGGQIEH